MRTIATAVVSVAMALSALGLAMAAPHIGGQVAPKAVAAGASGALRIANSREGQAVFAAGAMRPGESVSGTVRIGNDGDVPGRFSVRGSGIEDTPGPYGGRLSERVQLRLIDVTDAQQPLILFAGLPGGLAELDLGTIAPGARRDYQLTAALPDGGLPGTATGGDNRFQGSALSVGVEWVASAPAPAPTPAPRRRRRRRPRRSPPWRLRARARRCRPRRRASPRATRSPTRSGSLRRSGASGAAGSPCG